MKKKVCFYCGATAFRRINRSNFLQRTVLPWFGFFPWECAMCRKKSFYRDDGHSELRRKKKAQKEAESKG